MTKKLLIFIFGFLMITAVSQAEEAKPEATAEQKAPFSQEEMAKMQEFGTPNDNHKVLDAFVGDWDHTVKWWMTPDSTVEESTGTTQAKWIFGGRFVEQTVSGMAMGQPFEGKGVIGYDNVKKQYQSIWLDSMSTAMMISNSTYDAATKTFNEEGTASCPIEGGDKKFHGTIKMTDPDNYVYEMYTTDKKSGKEFKTMEITYKKKK